MKVPKRRQKFEVRCDAIEKSRGWSKGGDVIEQGFISAFRAMVVLVQLV